MEQILAGLGVARTSAVSALTVVPFRDRRGFVAPVAGSAWAGTVPVVFDFFAVVFFASAFLVSGGCSAAGFLDVNRVAMARPLLV